MKIILAVTGALMAVAGSAGIVDFKQAYDKQELPFLQQEHKVSSAMSTNNRDRVLKKHEHLTVNKFDFVMDGFSRGMIDFDPELLVSIEEFETYEE